MLTISLFRGLGAFASIALVYVVYYFYSLSISAEFFLFSSLCAFTTVVLKYGLDDYILKNFSQSCQLNPLYLIFKALILSFLIVIFIIIPVLPIYYKFSVPWYFFLVVPLSVANTLSSSYFQARKDFYVSLIGSSFIVPLATILIILIFLPSDLNKLVSSFCLAIFLQSAFLVSIFLQKKIYNYEKQKNEIFGRTQLVLWLNTIIGISSIHLIILVSNSFMTLEQFTNFVLILRTCQSAMMVTVVINFTFIPYYRACIVEGRFFDASILFNRTCYLGLLASITMTGLFWVAFKDFFTFIPSSLLEMKTNFFLLWPGFALSLCFGSIGYVFIMNSKERISTFVGFIVLIFQIFLIHGIEYYSYESFLIFMSLSYAFAKIILYFLYIKFHQFKRPAFD
tara:strand:- start:1284 stop:2471 length:1188 start_codon:yes stop_codon:yes gene_type:complete